MMADVISPTNQNIFVPTIAPKNIGAINAVQPQPAFACNHSSDDPFSSNDSTINGQPLSTHFPQTSWSRDASPGSFVGQVSSEKIPEQSSHRLPYRQSIPNSQEQVKGSDGVVTPQRNGIYRDSMADDLSKPADTPKRKSSGLRTTLRRIFGRKSAKNRISLPAPAVAQNHKPGTARPPLPTTPQRSVSAPTHEVLRSSALGSHSPFALQIPPSSRVSSKAKPPRPARTPPESPTRPRRATLPSIIFSAQEAETVNRALIGLGLQDGNEQTVDGENIGFAVTSGSNPRRRSRSVGAFQDANREHRMSPIQWHRWRRRSDEIRHWRESTDAMSPALDMTGFPSNEIKPLAADTGFPVAANFVKSVPAVAGKDGDKVAEDSDFNFDIPIGDIQSQEHIGLEERMVTLEIKLMDFEYAISKLQADSTLPIDRESGQFPAAKGSEYEHSPAVSAQQHSIERIAAPYMEYSPATIYGSSLDNTPVTRQSVFKAQDDQRGSEPTVRPISVAATLKPGPMAQRVSLGGLTLEHYSTLITLIRHEQSARHQLEDQVALLQRQIQLLKPPSPSSLNTGVRGLSPGLRQQRGRSSNYSGDETDTDEENFQDVYVTPVERGEYERQQLEMAEGVAF